MAWLRETGRLFSGIDNSEMYIMAERCLGSQGGVIPTLPHIAHNHGISMSKDPQYDQYNLHIEPTWFWTEWWELFSEMLSKPGINKESFYNPDFVIHVLKIFFSTLVNEYTNTRF